MEGNTATPVPTAPEAPGTPATPAQADTSREPAAAAPPAPASADTSPAAPDPRLGQAEYTRSQQAFSALKAELGLEPTATREQVIEAARQLRESAATEVDDDGEPVEVDEEKELLRQQLWETQVNVQAAIYGLPVATEVIDLINLARTTDDPSTLIPAFVAFAEGKAPAQPAAAPATPAPGADPGLPEGDPALPVSTQPAPRRSRESGVVGAIRGAFVAAGVARPAEQPPS